MPKRILLVLLGWLAAVLSVAVIASIAIDTAGRQVIAAPIAAPIAALPTATATTPTRVLEVGPRTPEVNLTARPNSTRSASSARPESHPNAADPPSERTAEPVVGTYSTLAGRVRVSCAGSRITLAGGYVQPGSGWAASVVEAGPHRVRVRFEQNHRRDLVLVAVCADGRPWFEQSRGRRHNGHHRRGGMFRDFDGSSDR